MELQFLGHSCFLLHDGTSKVLTDPFLTGNALAAAAANQVEADFIFVTHGHGDHVGDAVDIAKRTGATVCLSLIHILAFTVTAVVPVVVSLLTPAPPARIQSMVEELNRKD